MTTPGTSSSPGREHCERFQQKTGVVNWWELTLALAGTLLIVGFLGWGVKGWVEMHFQAAAVIADRPLESRSGHLRGVSLETYRFG